MEIEKLTQEQYDIINELGTTLTKLGAKSDLVSIVMSWGDTLPQEDVLSYLKEWNSKNQPQHQ
jgi:hypothetical protein